MTTKRLFAQRFADHATSQNAGTEAGGDEADLIRIRAALAAGLSPVEALGSAQETTLARIGAGARLGRPLSDLADEATQLDTGSQLLLRALAVAEQAGSGGTQGVEQALKAIRETRSSDRLLRVKTAQARGTAKLMAAVPVAAWILLVLLDRRAFGFYGTPAGMITGALAVVGMGAGRWWSRWLVARAEQTAAMTDPLQPEPPRAEIRRALVVGLPIAIVLTMLVGLTVGLVAGVVTGLVVLRPRAEESVDLHGGGTPEAAELLALALDSGLSVAGATDLVATLGPPAVRAHLATVHRRLESGWSPAASFDGTPLTALGELLDASHEWGAPAAPTLRAYAEELRGLRRAAAEEAAERTQLALVFPTTLLTLPAFALAVVPPLVWVGFAT